MRTLFGKHADISQVVGYCRYHKCGVTVEQLKKKKCLDKQCGALAKYEHRYWKQREITKMLRQLRKLERKWVEK